MNKNILSKNVQDFIDENLFIDTFKFLFKKNVFKKVSNKEIIVQIQSKSKAKDKILKWYNTEGILYPPKINLEQTSSEMTAKYKAQLIRGNSMVDATCGFGIDTHYFSKSFNKVKCFDLNSKLIEIVKYNSNLLKQNNVQYFNEDGIKYCKKTTDIYDLLYIDPSRRNNFDKKVFLLNECHPVINNDINQFLAKFNNILIKCSPLLDLKQTLNQINNIVDIHIIGVKNEVKEILIKIKKNDNCRVKIYCIELTDRSKDISFYFDQINNKEITCSNISTYLYEPSPMLLKSGAFNVIKEIYNLEKLNPNSHLYSSEKLISFQGRHFKISKLLDYNKNNLKVYYNNQANITTRNFPYSVQELRRKHKIKDGGSNYLFFTTDADNNLKILVVNKINE